MFTSGNNSIEGFLRMRRLLDFLETSNDKHLKADAIKAEIKDGFISVDEGLELCVEFCSRRA